MEERHTFKHESWSTSRGRESYTATGLLPNCHYTCHMVSVAQERQSDTDVAPQATFHTSPGSRLTAELHFFVHVFIRTLTVMLSLNPCHTLQLNYIVCLYKICPLDPSRPPRPRLSVRVAGKHTSNFSLELYPANNQFGPIE